MAIEIIPILHNIRSTYNVGSILRTADGFGVKSAILSGYTPRYNDGALLPHLREKLNHQIGKTALGAEQYLNLETTESIEQTLKDLRAKGYRILGLENNLSDPRKIELSLTDFAKVRSALISNEKDAKFALLLGEEVAGIDKSLYGFIDFFLEIPMKGQKESFNVSIATAICLFYLSSL